MTSLKVLTLKNNIVIFEPEIPENLGNIIRTCVATNSKLHLIKPFGFIFNESLLKRSSVNYLKYLDYEIYDSLDLFFAKNKEGEFYYLTRYGKKPPSSQNFLTNKPIYLLFGKETTGLPKKLLKDNLNHDLRIPMSKNVRALNLSNSVAIVIYEVLRQQNYPNLSFVEIQKGEDFLKNYEENK